MWLMEGLRAPKLSRRSSTPVTVTVWATAQLPLPTEPEPSPPAVKVNVAGLTVAASLPELTAISTLADGSVFSTTV